MVEKNLSKHRHGDYPERGAYIMLDFNPSAGKEIRSPHPALVVSDDDLARTTNFIWIMPVSHGNYGDHRLHICVEDEVIEGNIYTEQLMRIDYTARLWISTGRRAKPSQLAQAVSYAKLILGN